MSDRPNCILFMTDQQRGDHLGCYGNPVVRTPHIDAIADAFDLCRDPRHLAAAPNAQPCSYMQMGRCVGPCDGTIDADAYRKVVADALAFALGSRAELIARLTAEGHLDEVEPRYGALTLLSPLMIALLHQDGLQGHTVRPLDVEAMADRLVADFCKLHAA